MNQTGPAPYDVIVIGGGIAGMCAALRAAQYHLRTLVILGDRQTAKASRGKYVYNIDNMVGVHEGIYRKKVLEACGDAPEVEAKLAAYHFHISTQDMIDNTRERLREEYAGQTTLVEEAATAAEQGEDGFRVTTPSGTWAGRFLVLATGVMDRQPLIKKTLKSGKTLEKIQWVFPYANHETLLYCIRCEGHLTREDPCAVIGHSETTAQVAMMLHERYGTPVALCTNGEALTAAEQTRRLLEAYGIVVLESPIVDILGEAKGTQLDGFRLEDGGEVRVRFAFVALGLYRVYNDLARQLGMELEAGAPEAAHVLVDVKSESSVPNAFVVGDMARHRDFPIMKQVYTAQEYAVRAVDTMDRRLRRDRRRAILAPGAG